MDISNRVIGKDTYQPDIPEHDTAIRLTCEIEWRLTQISFLERAQTLGNHIKKNVVQER